MFFYLAKKATNAAQQTADFIQRSLSGLTQAKLSDLHFIAKADVHQIAYDGYRANIDVFLYATAMKSRVFTNITEAPVPILLPVTLPIPLPSIYFQFKTEPNPASKAKLMDAYAKYNIMENVQGKSTVYTMRHPDIAIVMEKLLPYIKDGCTPIAGYISVPSYIAATSFYRIVELFCATNTYPYSRNIDGDDMEDVEGAQQDIRHTFNTYLKRGQIIGESVQPAKRKRLDPVLADAAKAAGQFQHEDTPEPEGPIAYELPVWTETMTAKPSPLPSSSCYGSVQDVPYLPGIAFPYFRGLLAGDIEAYRIISRYFARNLPIRTETTREAIARFRKDFPPFLYTEEGLCMQHILKGMEFALESQTQLYLIFDHTNYLGFTLLGGKWHLYDGIKWVGPSSASDLRETLDTWITHDQVLDTIAEIVSGRPGLNGRDTMIISGDINTSMKLAKILGKTSWTGEEGKTAEKKVIELTRHFTFPSKYKVIGIESVRWALTELTTRLQEDLDDDINVYIPRDNLALFSQKSMLVFSAFGSLAPNFFASTGTTFDVPPVGVADSFLSKDGNRDKNPVVVIPAAPPHMCVTSWVSVCEKRRVRFEPNERSKESRCYVWKKKDRDTVWGIYKETIGTLVGTNMLVERSGPAINHILNAGRAAAHIDEVEW